MIQPTDNSIDKVVNANNPFTFVLNEAVTPNDEMLFPPPLPPTENKPFFQTKKVGALPDDTFATLNKITSLLKELQKIDDKEKDLLLKIKANTQNSGSTSKQKCLNTAQASAPTIITTRKRSRPQLIIKKMKSMLSTVPTQHNKTENQDLSPAPSQNNEGSKNDMLETSSGSTAGKTSHESNLIFYQNKKQQLSQTILTAVEHLRDDISEAMPGVVRRRAQKCSSVSPSPSINGLSSDAEIPILMGRCFNLSVNLKILKQCDFSDPAIACRVFVDFDVLENYFMKCKTIKTSHSEEKILNLNDGHKRSTSSEQLVSEINSLSLNINDKPASHLLS